jgi:hypothetical protein
MYPGDAWTDETHFPHMKNNKQKKLAPIEASKPELFLDRSREACKRLAEQVGELYGDSPVQISDIEQASAQLVSVYEREAVFFQDRKYVVIDVLFNPAFLNATFVAKIAHDAHKDNVLAKFQRAGHDKIKIQDWYELEDLAHDRKAISTLFRAYVVVDPAHPQVSFTKFYVYQRRDNVGDLNAVDYGSKQGVRKLLVTDVDVAPMSYRHGATTVFEFTRRNYDWCNLNIQRAVDEALEYASWNAGLTQDNVQRLVEIGLSDERIEKQLKKLAENDAEKKEIEEARDALDRAGYHVYANCEESISIGPKGPHDRLHCFSELRRSKAMLLKLAQAFGVVQI